MAPEIRGDPTCKPSSAVDIFSLGKVLVFVANGQGPGARTEDEMAPRTELLEEWSETIHACLKHEAHRRPTAMVVHDRLLGGSGHGDMERPSQQPGIFRSESPLNKRTNSRTSHSL
eukprot:6038604-Heterocapsa_arctica.AAC.1